MSSYYDVLDLEKSASDSDIKKAYRKKAMTAHPDKGGDAEAFKLIGEAYSVLSDPEKRQIYDKYGKAGLEQGGGASHMDPNDIFQQFMSGGFGGGGFGGDIFSQFAGQQRRSVQQLGDVVQSMKVSLDEIFTGKVKKVNIARKVIDNDLVEVCQACQGAGRVRKTIRHGPMIQQFEEPCRQCSGAGHQIPASAIKEKKQMIQFTILPGTPPQTIFAFPGTTNCTKPNCVAGSTIFEIEYLPHELYRVVENTLDLEFDLAINLTEALLGFERVIPYFNNQHLSISSSVPLEQATYTIFERGLPNPDKSSTVRCGNLHVRVKIEFPKAISRENVWSNLTDVDQVVSSVLNMNVTKVEGSVPAASCLSTKLEKFQPSKYDCQRFLEKNKSIESDKVNSYVREETQRLGDRGGGGGGEQGCQQS
jgi:DnaJ family protein A protein 2